MTVLFGDFDYMVTPGY